MRPSKSFVLSAVACGLAVPALVGCNRSGAASGLSGGSGGSGGWPTEPQMNNLMQMALDPGFMADREVIMTLVEIPPHTTLDWHWHPGEEFHYYLEGEVEIAIEGQPSIHGTPGTTGHIPLRAVHTAITREQGAKAIVFRVHTTGEPVRHLVEE